MAAYRRVYDSVTCRLTAKNRDQLRNPTLGNRVWATFTFYCYCCCYCRLFRFKPPSRRGSSQDSTVTSRSAVSVARTSVTSPPGQPGVRADEGGPAGARVTPPAHPTPPAPSLPPHAPLAAAARRPRPRDGLPINHVVDPTPPPSTAAQPGHRSSYPQRGTAHSNCSTHTHTRLTALCPGLPG